MKAVDEVDCNSAQRFLQRGGNTGWGRGTVGWPVVGPMQLWQDKTLIYCPANELMVRSGIKDFTVKVAPSHRKCWSVSRVIYELKAARSQAGGLSLG